MASGGQPSKFSIDTKRVARESEHQERIVINSSQMLNHSDRTRETAPLRADFAGKIGNDASGVEEAGKKPHWILEQVQNDS